MLGCATNPLRRISHELADRHVSSLRLPRKGPWMLNSTLNPLSHMCTPPKSSHNVVESKTENLTKKFFRIFLNSEELQATKSSSLAGLLSLSLGGLEEGLHSRKPGLNVPRP